LGVSAEVTILFLVQKVSPKRATPRGPVNEKTGLNKAAMCQFFGFCPTGAGGHHLAPRHPHAGVSAAECSYRMQKLCN
jgi:hypothetical protein